MLRSFVVALALACLLAPTFHAQFVNGAVRGIALDPRGEAIPDVVVTLTNLETGIKKVATTKEDGSYKIQSVEPAAYSLEFRREGFQTVVVDRIVIITANEREVKTTLPLGAVSNQITVEVPGLELEKSGPHIRMNLSWEVLDQTPMPTSSLVPAGSRNYLRYALMAPAVARVPGQNETSTNGHRGRENNYLADGVENNDNSVTLPAIFIPPEAIREFQVQVAPFSAEFGHSMGAQINVTTKSGGNAFHGEIWDFTRSSALEPLPFQNYKANQTKTPRLTAHQFGADLGGPIIPGKTFFFGIFQKNIQRQAGVSLTTTTIPTPAGYQALLTAALRPATVAVPTPQSAASRQAMLDALSFLPDFYSEMGSFSATSPNAFTVNGTAIETGQFVPFIPQNQDIWYAGGRIDHQLGNDTLSYRLHMDHRNKPLSSGNRVFGERWAADDLTFGQSHAINFTKTVASHWVNESRLAYTRLNSSFPERDPISPTLKITNLFTIGGSENFPQERLEQTYQFQNVSNYILGRHALKFGFDLARTGLDNNNAPNSKGTWTFATLESFMNNQPQSQVQLVIANSRYSFHELRQAYFLQDDIKVTRNFTANLGLRYELTSVPLGFFGATSQVEMDALVPAPVKRDTNNWAPRIGFAYSPEFETGILRKIFGLGTSSIRGGFGVSYDVLFYNLLSNSAPNYPRNNPTATTGASQLVDLYPTMPSASPAPTLTISTSFVNLPTETQRPTSNYWTLSLQRQLHQDYIVEVGYTGNRSYHLLRQSQANPGILDPAKAAFVRDNCTFVSVGTCQEPVGFHLSPFTATATDSGRRDPRWGSRALLESTGQAEYHAAYVRLEKRFSNGLQFGANYTWSANLSDSEDILIGDNFLVGSSPANPQDYRTRQNEWSRSVLDRPHRFSAQYAYRIPGFATSSYGVLRHALSGWQVSGFTELQSGQPFTIRVGVDTIGNGLSNAGTAARPNFNPGGTLTLDPDTGNLRTFRIPLDGTGIVDAPHVTSPTGAVTYLRNSMEFGGTLGRNTFRGPGLATTNLSLMKRFDLPRELQLQIRGDFLNVFNHHSFANPDANMTSVTFGQQILNPVIDSRQVLLGAKLTF